MRFKSARDAEAYLLGFINYELRSRYRPTTRSHDLRRFRRILAELGWEPGRVPSVHVGGTNGKGTVSLLTERVLRAGGLRTGLYTSPHLESIRERVRVDGQPISRSRFCGGVERLAEAFAAVPGSGFRTTFEHLTGLAFLEFQARAVDRAVIEVGLGGRLDATNVLPPGLVILTPVSLDHRHVLGRTAGAIAADKAHILKPGGSAVIMRQTRTAWTSIQKRLETLGIPYVRTGDAVRVEPAGGDSGGGWYTIHGATDYGVVRTRLVGHHQADNLAAAVAAAEQILPQAMISSAVRKGLTRVNTPGRLEQIVSGGRMFLLDGGHNPAAARVVARAIRETFPGRRVLAVVGLAKDKDHRGYLSALEPVVDRFICTAADYPRAAPPETLAKKLTGKREIARTVRAALSLAFRRRGDVVLVAGSFVLAGEARRLLKKS